MPPSPLNQYVHQTNSAVQALSLEELQPPVEDAPLNPFLAVQVGVPRETVQALRSGDNIVCGDGDISGEGELNIN
jgi:hypothetical protein